MKCPKCGYVSFNYLERCKKCGRDLVAFKAEHNLWGIKPGTLNIYSSMQQAMEQGEPRPVPSIEDLTDLEEGLPHGIEMIEEEDEEPTFSQDALSSVIPEAELEGIQLDLGEIDFQEEEEVTLALQDRGEEVAMELEEIALVEEAGEGTQKEEPPGGSPPIKGSPLEIDLDLEEIELVGGEPEEKGPLMEMDEETEDASDLLDLEEIELSWEDEEEEQDPGKKEGR
ncbi:MAG: hypothetical protein HYS70_03690 [Nitrospinae bacterium]|nr:hypothetical protein [Nitrospinota bacterium]